MTATLSRPVERPTARRRHRSLFAGVAALIAATVMAVAPSAEAASSNPSYTAGDFSAAVNPNVRVFWVDNCRVEVGIVFDWTAYPGYAHVGGVRVNCGSYHSVIDATVALYYYDGARWVQYGSGTHGVRYNSAGSGSSILYTPRYCVGSLKYSSWMVGTTVRTERAGLTNYSYSVRAGDGSGC
jgi:hypothetical protein